MISPMMFYCFKLFILWLAVFLFFISPRVHANTSFFTEQDYKEIFLREFKARVNIAGGDISVEKFRVEPSDIRIPKGTPYKIDWIGPAKAGSNVAIVTFSRGGGVNQIVRLWGFVEIKVPVVVVKQNLPNGALLEESNLVQEMRELSRLPQDVVSEISEAIGKETRMSIKAGTVLRRAHITEPLVIRRNQEVEIIARGRNFEVKAKGIALQNGRLGEFIRVKNISSQKIIQAKVSGEGKVEVSF